MNEYIHSFSPILGQTPQILILGTMPGVASLRANEYYAHPTNAFWKIMATINNLELPMNYEDKKKLLTNKHIALWDVCHTCIRPGSADNDIHNEIPNPIGKLLADHPSIQTLFFNGQTAHKLFHRHFDKPESTREVILPSTSPAYTLPFQTKLQRWSNEVNANYVNNEQSSKACSIFAVSNQ